MSDHARRAEPAIGVAGVVLIALSLRSWWHDRFTNPSSVVPWRASTVWSACIVVVSVVAIVFAVVRHARVRLVLAVLAIVSAAWAVAFTVELYRTGPGSRGWWAFDSLDATRTHAVTLKIGLLSVPSVHRDELAAVSSQAGPTRTAFVGLGLMVLLAVTIAILAWRRRRHTAVGR